MGQGSSELHLASHEAKNSPPPPPPFSSSSRPPRLRWLRVSRSGRGSLTAEWRWWHERTYAGDLAAARCHLLFLRSDDDRDRNQDRDGDRMRRVPVDPRLPAYGMSNLSENAPYRVCLQCTTSSSFATSSGNTSHAGDVGTLRSAVGVQARDGRPVEIMHCVNVSTKQAHLPAIIGSCLGALLALVLVLILVLVSRRTRRYRKVNERQEASTSSNTNKKVFVHEIAYQTDHMSTPPPPDEASPMQTARTPTPPPPDEASPTQTARTPTPPPPLPTPPTPSPLPPPPTPPSNDPEAGVASSTGDPPASTSASTASNSAGAGGGGPGTPALVSRQVIQVNETDEYSIDLRLCDSLSRQQSLKTANTASASASTSAPDSDAATTADSAAVAASATGVGEDNHQEQPQHTVPSLYTQLIETL